MPPPPPPRKTTPKTGSFPAATSVTPIVERSELKGSGKPTIPSRRQISQDEIARRAFEIYAGRGYAPGDQTADWHEAERQLRAGL